MFWYVFMVLQSCHYTAAFFFQLFNLFLTSFSSFVLEPMGIFFLSLLSLLFYPFPPLPYPHLLPILLLSLLVLLPGEHEYLYAKPTAISNIWISVWTQRCVFKVQFWCVLWTATPIQITLTCIFLNIGLSMFLSTDNHRFSPARGWASPPSCWALPNPINVEKETQNIWELPRTPFHS